MLRKLSCLMALILAICCVTPALALNYATSGNGSERIAFYVESHGKATITLKQVKGECEEKSVVKQYFGSKGTAEECGKYHIIINTPNNTCLRDEWDSTFWGSEHSFTLSKSGVYEIIVEPYTAQEMTDSWKSDTFIRWTKPPQWWVSSGSNCSYSAKPFSTASSGTQSGSGTSTSSGSKGNTSSGSQGSTSGSNTSGSTARLLSRPVSVWLKNPSVERIRPQCGPGHEYSVFASMNGSTKLYKPRDITYMAAHFRVGNWLYVEFGYTDGVLRYGFFESSLFDSNDWGSIPSCSLSTIKSGYAVAKVTPYNGPGYHCGSYSSCSLEPMTPVYACMESNGWYFCRFYNNHGNNYGNVYLWIPGNYLAWN